MARVASSRIARCNASISAPPSSGTGDGRTRAPRKGSVCSILMITTRSTPCAIRSTVPSGRRAMRLMTAFVPMLNRSSAPGDSTAASRCVTTTISLSSLESAVSIAATEAGRLTVSGSSRWGKRTVFLTGSSGSIRICSLSFIVRLLIHGHADEQHALAAFHPEVRALQLARQFKRPLEAVVNNFHCVMIPPFLDDPVAARAANQELRPAGDDGHVLGAYAGQIEFNDPPVASAEDVGHRTPRRRPAGPFGGQTENQG